MDRSDLVYTLHRRPSGPQSTIGVVTRDAVGDGHLCFTCEDVVRDIKIPGETAIPAGRYRIIVTHSARFGRALPLLLDVPGFNGVRIHPGNTAHDTEGCILPGLSESGGIISRSRDACALWQAEIEQALLGGRAVYLDIRNAA